MFVIIDDVHGYWKQSRGWSQELDDAELFPTVNHIPDKLINMWRQQYNSNVYILEYQYAEKCADKTNFAKAKSVHSD